MAITEADYLLLRDEKGREWLMLKSERQFHLVRVDAALTEKVYERLMKRYPCSLRQLQELGLHVTPLNREKCTHAIFDGLEEGDKLTLWFSGDVRRFTLAKDHSREGLASFFDAQQHRWDLPQVPAGPDGKLTRIIGWSLNGLSFVLLILALSGRYLPWLTLVLFAVSAVLCVCWPGRFLAEEQSKGGDRRVIRVGMEMSLIAPPLVMLLDMMDHAVYRSVLALFLWGAALGLVIGIAILWRSREYRNEGIWLLIGLILVSSGPLGQVNQLLDFGPTTTYTVPVEETEENRQFRGGPSYYCYVTMPDGEREQFSITRSQFAELQPGDPITIIVHDGGLGLEYLTIDWDEQKTRCGGFLHRVFRFDGDVKGF